MSSHAAPKVDKTRRPRDRRDQIAENASELFSARGFHSVRMDDIAEASGITARALYRHYANKQALLSHVVTEDQARLVEALSVLEIGPAEDRTLSGSLAVLADAALGSRRLSLLWQREARHLGHEDYCLVRDRTRWIAEQFERLVIRPERPDLDDDAAAVRSWAVVSILTSPGHYEFTLSRQRLVQELIAASERVITESSPSPEPDGEFEVRATRKPNSRREQLIDAAARAFRRNGYAGVSIDDIGRDVGVVGPALYRYFDTKVEILVDAVTRFHEWQALETSRALSRPGPDNAVSAALVSGYVRIALEATDLLAVSLTEWLYLPPEVGERLERIRADNVSEWQRWLTIARPDVSETRAAVLVNIAKTIIDDCVRIPHLQRDPRFAGELVSIATSSLGLG